nr:hypothetical protein CFP56_14716 [Quercus suber]
MASLSAQADYAAFEERRKRTVYLDNLSPQVTEPVVKTALNQFGNVKSVQFIPNYIEPRNIPQCALVEMENTRQAEAVLSEIFQFPFMISGMPRPKTKALIWKNAAESAFLQKQVLQEEEKLARQQDETLKANYKKFELIDSITLNDKTGPADKLAKHYNLKIAHD